MSLYLPLNDLLIFDNVKNHVDFLDGFRGTLALWVLIHHCNYFA